MVSKAARKIAAELKDGTPLGDIKKRGASIQKDHALAMDLWATGRHPARLLAVLILDRKLLDQAALDALATDIEGLDETEGNQLADWLLANQLMKDKKTAALLTTWQGHASPVLRRLYWYHQARLRWTGQAPPDNTAELMKELERNLAREQPRVQWAMNFCAGWIGVHEPAFRARCVKLGQKTGLYKDESVPKNCTPSYLPEFIRIEAAKREA